MGYANMQTCLADLEANGQLVRIDQEIDPRLEAGVVQRRVYRAGGPALLFTRVKGCRFPMAANIFGTMERMRFIFRDALPRVEHFLRCKADPTAAVRSPLKSLAGLPGLAHIAPKKVADGPVLQGQADLADLPKLVSWPKDGGAFITLPQVYTENPASPGFKSSNLGMYRVQISGGEYGPGEVGLHYQIHRGIGPHHAEALHRGEPLRVNVFVGGAPAMTLAAVMPLPEGVPEILFAGLLAGRRIRMVAKGLPLPVPAEADFCLVGRIEPGAVKPEGPFGDHLGYYSLAHDFPVLTVERVLARPDAIWPFTTVGRPPQEDTVFGAFIHELTKELIPATFAGVREVHAVDAAGVHPLLLALGAERYVPFARERRPQELITCALSLLGQTQTSLSKYALIAAAEDAPGLSTHDIPAFFSHMLERADFTRDLHFITRTTMDTLDYSGISLNQGSKLVWASCGKPRRRLAGSLPADLPQPEGFADPQLFRPGIMVLRGPKHDQPRDAGDPAMERLAEALGKRYGQSDGLTGFGLVVVVDDAAFTAKNWENFLWVAFTRSDPATDLYGVGAFTHCKHWGCEGPLVMDARLKSYHAPELTPDEDVERRVDHLFAKGGPLAGVEK
ncbi:MAG: UbiD family decarboxylase [Desulfovibrionaceae bacterium]